MSTPTILISTWGEGLFSLGGAAVRQELAQRSVRSLTADGRGGVLAIVDGHRLCRRSPEGEWTTLIECDLDLSCCVAWGDAIFLGADDAQILRLASDGVLQRLTGFDAVEGRDRWYAGSAIVDGVRRGPPLGVRSMAATCDGVLLANVHVGGVPRSPDGGLSWTATIDIDADVHEVCAHPTRPELVIAAAAVGLCISRDAGATWSVEPRGLHAPHCSAVAFGRTDIFVSASTDPFSSEGAIYRRQIDNDGPLQPLGGGMPMWTDGRADSHCIASRESNVAIVDCGGRLYLSQDDGETWSTPFDRIPAPSALLIC